MTAKDAKTAKEERKARLAAALRANLHRRKAQARPRRDDEEDNSEAEKSKGPAR